MLKNLMTAVMICVPANMAMAGVDFGKWEKGSKHVLELRTYHAAPGKLDALLTSFRDHTQGLFEKHGMTNLACFQFTADQPGAEDRLLYFLAYKNMDAATKSWTDLRADPVWLTAKKESEEKAGGSLTTEYGALSVFLNPTDFSPLK